MHRLSPRAGSGEASWSFSSVEWLFLLAWKPCPADLKRLSLHWLDPVRTEGSYLLKSLSKKMETQCAVSKPKNSNTHWPGAWTKEQRKILYFCLRDSQEIFLKGRRFSLISTNQCAAEASSHGTYRVHCRREGMMWRRGLKWKGDWSTAGDLGPEVGPTWWETPKRDHGVQTDMQLQLHHRPLRPPARKEPEGMWLPWGSCQAWLATAN